MYCMSTGGYHLPVKLENNKSVVHIIPNDHLIHNDIQDVTQFCKKNNKKHYGKQSKLINIVKSQRKNRFIQKG